MNIKQQKKDSTAYLMNNILESAVTSGFNGGARVSGSHVAAKTGTSNFPDSIMKKYKLPAYAVNDLWTVAYTSQYSIALWYGYEDVTIGYNTDGSYKDNTMKEIMKYIPKDTKGWNPPSSVVAVQVEAETWPAKLPSENTPKEMITTEYFIRGTQPTQVSERYQTLSEVTNPSVNVIGNKATISWNYTMPTVLTDEYIDKYFSNSIFAKSKNDLIEKRKKYNKDTLGEIGFAIYKENTDGTLELLTYTNEYSYTFEGYEPTTIVIKAEHQKYKTNASNGTKMNIALSGATNESLIATLEGKIIVNTTVGTYQESGIKNIYYGINNVTSLATVKYQLTNNTIVTDYNDTTTLETAINQLPAGEYKISYIISYKGKEITKNRTIILK